MNSPLANRILAGLLTPHTLVLNHDEQHVLLRMDTPLHHVLVLNLDGDTSPAAVKTVVSGWVKKLKTQIRGGLVHIVCVSQHEFDGRALKKCAPFLQISMQFGFYTVTEVPSQCTRVTGPKCAQLEKAFEIQHTVTPLDISQIQSQQAHSSEALTQESRLKNALSLKRAYVTATIIAVCVALRLLSTYWEQGNANIVLLNMGANFGEYIKSGQVWRLLSSAFLHANFVHLLVNMFALFSFGAWLEKLLGWQRFLFLYGASALGGSLASAFLRTESVVSVGASGAIWGLMGAGIALQFWPRDLLPPHLLKGARNQALVPLGINIAYSMAPGIDLLCHLGGGIAGFALVATGWVTNGVTPLWKEPVSAVPTQVSSHNTWQTRSWIVGVSLLASVLLALATGKPWTMGRPPHNVSVNIPNTSITMQIPDALTPQETTDNNGVPTYTFGSLENNQTALEITVFKLPSAIAPEDYSQFLEQQRKDLSEVALPNATRVSEASVLDLKGKQVAFVQHKMGKVLNVQTWTWALNEAQLIVRQYTWPNSSQTWQAVGEHAVMSARDNRDIK